MGGNPGSLKPEALPTGKHCPYHGGAVKGFLAGILGEDMEKGDLGEAASAPTYPPTPVHLPYLPGLIPDPPLQPFLFQSPLKSPFQPPVSYSSS